MEPFALPIIQTVVGAMAEAALQVTLAGIPIRVPINTTHVVLEAVEAGHLSSPAALSRWSCSFAAGCIQNKIKLPPLAKRLLAPLLGNLPGLARQVCERGSPLLAWLGRTYADLVSALCMLQMCCFVARWALWLLLALLLLGSRSSAVVVALATLALGNAMYATQLDAALGAVLAG